MAHDAQLKIAMEIRKFNEGMRERETKANEFSHIATSKINRSNQNKQID